MKSKKFFLFLLAVYCLFALCFFTIATAQGQETVAKNELKTGENDPQKCKELNILLMSTPGAGQIHPILALGEELVTRGHNVTLCSGTYANLPELKIKEMAQMFGIHFLYNQHVTILPKIKFPNPGTIARLLREEINAMLSFWFKNLSHQKDKWDIIVFNDLVVYAAMCIHSKEKIPVVMAGAATQVIYHTHQQWPWPHTFGGFLSDDLSFFQRLKVTIVEWLSTGFSYIMIYSPMSTVYAQHCPKADFTYLFSGPGTHVPYIVPTEFGFEYPRVVSPLTHYVGPFLQKHPDPLPQNLKQWLDNKEEKSVIYISMGSVYNISEGVGKAFIDGIMRTDYSALWALRQPEIVEGIQIDPERAFIIKWAPQLSILQHKSISMAIVHGGYNGVHEALYNGVPVIVCPLFSDQFGNAGRVHYHGLGVRVNPSDLTADTVTNSIHEIDTGDYHKRIEQIKKIFAAAGGVEKAADFVEFYTDVGFEHLIPAYAKYNWNVIQYYNVDVYALLMVFLVANVFGLLKCCQCLGRRCVSKKKTEKMMKKKKE